MSDFSRRRFIGGVSAASVAGLLTVPFGNPRNAAAGEPAPGLLAHTPAMSVETTERKPLTKVKIGKTGLETTLLGVGTGTHGGNDFLNMGQNVYVDLLMHAFNSGIRYIDTAENYRTHIFTRFALKEAAKAGIKREDFFLLSKSFARTGGAAKVIVDRYLYEMECKYLDALLMHCLTEGDWPKRYREVVDVLVDERKRGRVKSIGVSVHSLQALEAALEVDELDIVLVRINPYGTNMDAAPDKVVPVIKKMHEKGLGILGMKIYGEGKFTEKEQRFESLKYAMNLGCVDAMTIGFTQKSHIDETLDMVAQIQAEA